jgi:hypothetical protein
MSEVLVFCADSRGVVLWFLYVYFERGSLYDTSRHVFYMAL